MRLITTCSLLSLAVLASGLANAYAGDKDKDSKNKDRIQAVISKVDADQHSVTIKTTDGNGQKQEKTLELAKDAKLLDSDGKKAKLSDFQPGDDVCIKKQNDKVAEIRKHAEATITKVDAKAGTITVKMPDKQGKETERTFKLVEDAEFIDSMGRIAVLDVFKSGDDVLIIESEGKLQAMKKAGRQDSSATARGRTEKSKSR